MPNGPSVNSSFVVATVLELSGGASDFRLTVQIMLQLRKIVLKQYQIVLQIVVHCSLFEKNPALSSSKGGRCHAMAAWQLTSRNSGARFVGSAMVLRSKGALFTISFVGRIFVLFQIKTDTILAKDPELVHWCRVRSRPSRETHSALLWFLLLATALPLDDA